MCSEKVRQVIERYLDRLLEPQVVEEANLAQITKTLEMLLENGGALVELPQGQAEVDPISLGLMELAREMEVGE